MLSVNRPSGWRLAVFLAAFSLFGILLVAIASDGALLPQLRIIDARIENALPTSAAPFWSVVTVFGGPTILSIVGVALIAALLHDQRRRDAALVAAAAAIGLALDLGIKAAVARGRPDGTELAGALYSFPSGHALMATILYGSIVLFAIRTARKRRVAAVMAILIILLIGASRVALHRHYASDVIAGVLLGIAVLAETIFCEDALRTLRTQTATRRKA